jgi:hypothetical protein
MSEVMTPASGSAPTQTAGGLWPRTALGRAGIVAAVVGLASWVVLPVVTTMFRDTYPVVDTWVMPAIATTLIDVAAVLNLVAVWLRRERSLLSILALAITLLAALFFTFMVVGETIAGA